MFWLSINHCLWIYHYFFFLKFDFSEKPKNKFHLIHSYVVCLCFIKRENIVKLGFSLSLWFFYIFVFIFCIFALHDVISLNNFFLTKFSPSPSYICIFTKCFVYFSVLFFLTNSWKFQEKKLIHDKCIFGYALIFACVSSSFVFLVST